MRKGKTARRIKRLWKIFRMLVLIFFVASILTTLIYRFVSPPVTPLMIIRVFDQMFHGEKLILKKQWVSMDKISESMPLAAVASEDQNFTSHFGFDFQSMKEAYNKNRKGKKIKGASTITQQVAKNVFLWPGRSYVRKAFEAYFTLLIEVFWTKKRILEVYLNEIEFGKGIYGVEMASRIYFHKSASKLSIYESASLAAILPNPRKWSPVNQVPIIRWKTQWIIRNMNNLGKLQY